MAIEEQEFEKVAARLRSVLGVTSDTALAELLGFKRTAWVGRKKRGSLPHDEIDALCEARGINTKWVYEAQGQPRVGVPVPVKPLQEAARAVAALSLDPDEARLLQEILHYTLSGDRVRAKPLIEKLGLATVPRRNAQASAGNGSITEVHDDAIVDAIAFQPDWLRAIGVRPGAATVIAVRGDSMADTLHDGDLILVDTSLVERRVPGVYVLLKGESLLVKRLHFKASGGIEIRSDNKAYPTETISSAEFDQLHIVGRMVRRLVR